MKKRYINTISRYCLYSISALAMMFVVACADDEVMSGREEIPEGDGVGLLQLKTGISSMAGSADLESKINKVRIVAFSSTSGEVKFNEVYPNGENANPEDVLQEVKTGYTDVCIIVNETPAMTIGLNVQNIDKETIRQQMLSYTDFSLFANQDSLAKCGIPMYKEYDGLPIKIANVKNNPYRLSATVDRVLAKLTLRIANNTHKKDVKLESVKLQSLPQHSWLYPSEYNNEETISSDAIPLTPNVDKSKYEDVILYIPEYMLNEITKRSYLNISGVAQIGTSATDTIHCHYRITLGNSLSAFSKEAMVEKALSEGKLNEKDFSIIRNTHYEIDVTDIKGYEGDKLTFVVGVAPWINVKEGAYEGGVWRKQPVSSRIPIYGETSFTAKFIHTDAPKIVYKWYRSQYEQTVTNKEPAEPTIQLLQTEVLENGKESTYTFAGSLPTESGEIYCEAAPIGGQHFRESNRVTLMVVGDWDGTDKAGNEQELFPKIQDWTPTHNVPLGASYLLRDTRDSKIYRTKLMADGRWWMIQELAFSELPADSINPVIKPALSFFVKSMMGNMVSGYIGVGLYGACCYAEGVMGGYLYTPAAALGNRQGIIASVPSDSKSDSDLIGLCPKGWHLPGNMNDTWNEEWVVLNKSLGGLNLAKAWNYNYYSSLDFNSYTLKFVAVNAIDQTAFYTDDGAVGYCGGFGVFSGFYLSMGVKFGITAKIPIDATKENILFNTQEASPIRCIRD